MAVVASVSSPTSGAEAVFTILNALTASGWIVKGYGNGAAVFAQNVTLNSNPLTVANLSTNFAWCRIAAPDSSREWIFQKGSGGETFWYISRSKAGFTLTGSGTVSATVSPTASDAQALFGAAAASPAGTQAFPTSPSTTWRMFISLDNAAPYGFVVYGIVLGGGNVQHFLIDEPLASGTTDTSDTDPYIWWGYYNATGLPGMGGINTVINQNIFKRFTGAGSNQTPSLPGYNTSSNGTMAPAQSNTTSQMGLTPNTLREVILPIVACRPGASSSTTGWIGTLNRLRWGTVGGRANGQTLGPVSGSYWIFLAGAWVPWDSTEPALS